MNTRILGNTNLKISALGFGCMGMSWAYDRTEDKSAMISLLRKAVDLGITCFDTAEVYGLFKTEELVGEALFPVRGQVAIATKVGYGLDPNGVPHPVRVNSKSDHIRRVADPSLKRRKTDRIDPFYQHRVDPEVAIEEVAGVRFS